MQYKTIPLAALLLLAIVPLVSASFDIQSVSVQTIYNDFTHDAAPPITITLSGNPSEANQMSFSCDGTSFSSPIDHNGETTTIYSEFVVNSGSFGCSTSDGNRNIIVRITEDQNQELYKEKASNDFHLDTTGPIISNQSPASGARTGNQPTIGFSFDDTGIGISNANQLSVIINGDSNNPIQTPELVVNMTTKSATYTPPAPLPEGTNNIEVGAFDDLGNISATTWSFIVDTNAHLASISINGGALYARSRDSNMSAQGDSDLTACQFRMDGGSYSANWIPLGSNMPFQLSETDGNKTVFGKCKDALEHPTEERSDTILLDTAAPTTSTLSFPSIQTSQISLFWTDSTDSGSGLKEYEIRKDGAIIATLGTTIHDYNAIGLAANTLYTFRLVARDWAGNESYAEETRTTPASGNNNNSSGDTVAPTISWLEPNADAVLSGKAKLRVQVNDNNGVKSVSFYANGTNTANLLTRIYYSGSNQIEFEWDTTNASNGNHDLFAKADDWSNNQAQIMRKIKVQNTDENQGNDQNANPEKQSAKTALESAKTEQQKAKAMIDLAKQFSFDFSEAQGKYSEANSKLNASKKACDQNNFLDCKTKSNEAIALFQEAASKTGLNQESSIVLGEPGALDFKGIFLASKLNPALAAFAEEIQSQMQTERRLIVFKRTTEDGNSVFFVRVELKITNNSGADNDFILVELVPKVLTQSSDELVGTPEFVVLEKDPLLEWKLDGFKNGEEMVVSYTIDKAFSEQEIQALLNSSELNSYKLAPLIVKASAVQNTPMLLVPSSLLGLALLANPTVLAILIGILVTLAFAYLVWQKNKSPRWPGRNAW